MSQPASRKETRACTGSSGTDLPPRGCLSAAARLFRKPEFRPGRVDPWGVQQVGAVTGWWPNWHPFRADNRHNLGGLSDPRIQALSEDYRRTELITGNARQRQWSTQEKLRILEESFERERRAGGVGRNEELFLGSR